MNINQYKFTGNDESYTYPNLVNILLPYLEEFKNKLDKNNLTIWCPFDLKEDIIIDDITYFKSNYVDIFEKEGYKVISSHILTGEDFFEYEPSEEWDIIVSNPPFKNKKLFFERALSFNKPFVLLAPASWFNDSGVNNIFSSCEDKLSLIVPNRRARFFNNKKECIGNRPSFKSVYCCYDFIDRGIYFTNMEKEQI